MKRIYLDYAAGTPIDSRVERVVLKYSKIFANPSSIHASGREARELIETSRNKVAKVLNVRSEEVVFTSSGTEADNLAILGIARANKSRGDHIITLNIEHSAILNACHKLEEEGFKVTYITVEKNGIVDPEKVISAIKKETILISIQYANSEIGAIQPIKEIAKKVKEKNKDRRIIFHTDAAQAAGFLNLNINQIGVDAMSLNGSKIYGPKGTGCLFVKTGVSIEPLIFGGGQERGLRSGTESPALTAGFAEALTLVDKNKEKESKRLQKLRDYLIQKLRINFKDISINGDLEQRLPNNVNVSFGSSAQDGEMLVLKLDRKGIEVSTGSACTDTQTGPSHVIQALSLADKYQNTNIRITMGKLTSKEDLDYLVKVLKKEI